MVSDVVGMSRGDQRRADRRLEVEDEVFSPARLRAWETAQAARRHRLYRVVARERRTGVLAGHTLVGADNERPWFGHQYDTSVVRTHRGHRLGMYLKIDMLRWLRTAEPQLRVLDTWNFASNDHMVAINELLGYRIVARGLGWQRRLPAQLDSPWATQSASAEPAPVTVAASARQPRLEAAPRDQRS
jgi:L-amino acid N-acyltransferase YncA